jgi:phage shock protein A
VTYKSVTYYWRTSMNLIQRLQFLLKAMLNDLFGEEQTAEIRRIADGETTAERLTGLLDDAQRQLDTLRLELGKAIAHQKRIAQAWQQAENQVKRLDAAVDEAVKAGQDDQAREYLAKIKPAQEAARELCELTQACEQRSADLRIAVNQQQDRLDALRRRALALTDRELSVTALDEMFGDQRSLSRQTEKLQTELSSWEEQIARREDHLTARREWNK